MRMESEKFELRSPGGSTLGTHALTFKKVNFIIPLNQEDIDDLFRFLGPVQEGQEAVCMRRGADNSWHPCHWNDPGAVMFVGPPGA